jgi:hypothetical protein
MKPIIARKCDSFVAVSKLPDVCLTPCGAVMVPVPYPILCLLGSSISTVSSVRANGEPLFVLDTSAVPTVIGDEAGVGGGVKSGTHKGTMQATTSSKTVRAKGKYLVRHADSCEMNF